MNPTGPKTDDVSVKVTISRRGNTVPSAGRAFRKQFGNPQSANHSLQLDGNKKALSKALGAKGYGGGPNSEQRSMLLIAVRSRRSPISIPPTVNVNL